MIKEGDRVRIIDCDNFNFVTDNIALINGINKKYVIGETGTVVDISYGHPPLGVQFDNVKKFEDCQSYNGVGSYYVHPECLVSIKKEMIEEILK